MTESLNVVFAGTPDFSVLTLAALARWCAGNGHQLTGVFTQPDRPAGRGRKLRASPVKAWAIENDVAVYQPVALRAPDQLALLQECRPDILIVAAYGLLLPAAVLDLPRLGCINVHASLLPRWRGAAPIQRAILGGDSVTGISIMQMDIGLDTGAVWSRAELPIGDTETGGSLHDKLSVLGAELLIETMPLVIAGTSAPEPQPEEGVTYASKLSKQEARIDWTQPARDIERMIRAYNPWPIAHTTLEGQGLRVFSASVVHDDSPAAAPGSIVATDTVVKVATIDGYLLIDELQMSGSRRMRSDAFLNAHVCLNKELI